MKTTNGKGEHASTEVAESTEASTAPATSPDALAAATDSEVLESEVMLPNELDTIAQRINLIYARKSFEMATEVGEYVVETFYGDIDAYKARTTDDPNLKALTERGVLQMSHSMLWSCVAVYVQAKELPPDVASQLSFTHHRALLPLKDTRKKAQVAQKAVESGLRANDLKRVVANLTASSLSGKSKRRGRKPDPVWYKAARRVAQELGPGTIDSIDVDPGDTQKRQEALKAIHEAISQLEALKAKLGNAKGD